MAEISPSVVEETWDEVEQIAASRIPIEMGRLASQQPDLVAFIFGMTEGLGARVSELAGFILFVTWRVFQRESRGKLKRVTPGAIQRKLEENERSLQSLDEAEGDIDEASIRRLTTQPALFASMLAAIAVAEEEEEQPLVLSEGDKGELILLLKTAIDTLDDARSAAESKARLSS